MSDAEQIQKIYAIFTDVRLDVETRQPAKVYAENAHKLIDLFKPTHQAEAKPLPPEGCLCGSFWTVRQAHKSDCPVASKVHESVGLRPVDGELRKIVVGAAERGNMFDGYVASAEFNAEAVKIVNTYLPMLQELFAAHIQAAEKAYGGCHDCYGKGYATANEFASGRGAKWRISSMRFCKCERGQQLKMMMDQEKNVAVREAESIHYANYRWLLGYEDFPESQPGARYNWRPELRKRIPESMLQQLKQGAEHLNLYICDNQECSKLHTKDEIKQLKQEGL